MVAAIAITSFGLLFYSCKKEDLSKDLLQKTKSDKSLTFLQENLQINYGEIHNQVMDSVYDAVESKLLISNPSERELKTVSYEAFRSALIQKLNISNSTLSDFLIFCQFEDNFTSLPEAGSLNNAIYSNQINAINDSLLRVTFTQVLKMVDCANNFEAFNDFVLEKKALFAGTPSEEIFNVVSDIAISSYGYWDTNGNKWMDLDKIEASKPIDPRCKRIIKADVGGAIRGAFSGAAFAGVGALAGACLGASFGSAAEGLCVALGW